MLSILDRGYTGTTVKNYISIFISTRIPKIQLETLLFIHYYQYSSDPKEYLTILITLPPTWILGSFNFWRNTAILSSKLRTICESETDVGEFSAWNLGFSCPNEVWIARLLVKLTGKMLMRDFNPVKIHDGANTSYHNLSFWNIYSSTWIIFCKIYLHEEIQDSI